MRYEKRPISARIEDDIYRRIEIVAAVDRRSIADVMAECVRRALPALEAELEQPRLTPEMKRRIAAGESVGAILMENLAPLAQPLRVNSPSPAPTPAEAAARAVLKAATASRAPSPGAAAPTAQNPVPAAAGQKPRGGRR